METFEDLTKRIVLQLNRDGFEYMLTGAVAASHYGKPRTTMDIDFIISVTERELPRLLKSLTKAGLEINREKVKTTIKAGDNIRDFKDTKSPHSVDIILSKEKLNRKLGSILKIPTFYQTPEELILSKLRMIKVTIEPERAMKDKQDIKSILNEEEVNLSVIRNKAAGESTLDILKEIMEEA